MAFRIFVGNLSYDVADDDLRDAFSPFGDVVFSRVILDRETGKSRGFGFVELKDESAGQKALDALNGSQLKDRELRLKQAEPRDESGGGGRPREGGGGFSGAPRTSRPRPTDRDGTRDFGAGQSGDDAVRRRPPPKKPKDRDSGDKFRAPHTLQGRPTEKTKGGSKNRLQGYDDDEDDDDSIISNYADDDYEYDLSEVEGVEIEGVEIEGVDLSGLSGAEPDADDEAHANDADGEGLAQQLKRSLEKREEEES